MRQRELKAQKCLHDFTNEMISSRRKELERIKIPDGNEVEDDDIKAKNLLDLLLQSKIDDQPMTTKDIREELDTLLFAVMGISTI